MAEPVDCALDLMRRLPPQNVEDNLAALLDIVPHLTEDLLSAVDQPLKIAYDQTSKRDYLLCDYNRDGDSYRSPWSNRYDPPLADGAAPSEKLREVEVQANRAFDIYRDLYFEGGVSSVYLWDLETGFAGVILIKKTQDIARGGQPMKGTWDSIHVVEVTEQKNSTANYQLTSTVMLSIETENEKTGSVSLAGSLTRQTVKEATPVDRNNTHIANIGRMVEDMEINLRGLLDTIYFGKTKDVLNVLRKKAGMAAINQQKAAQGAIASQLNK